MIPAMTKHRLQINLRIDDVDLEMVAALRRAAQSGFPSATDIWRQALKEKYDRHRAVDRKAKK